MKLIKTISIVIAAFFISVYALIWLFSPMATRYVLSDVLAEHQIALASDSQVRVNLFLSKISVSDVRLFKNEKNTYQLDELTVQYSLWRLLLKEVYIKRIALKGMSSVVELGDTNVSVAGFALPVSEGGVATDVPGDNSNKEPSKEQLQHVPIEKSVAYSLSAPEILLEDITFSVNNRGHEHTIKINSLHIQRSLYKNEMLASKLQLASEVDGVKVELGSNIAYENGSTNIGWSAKISNIQPSSILYLLPENIQKLAGKAEINTQGELTLADESVVLNNTSFALQVDDALYRDRRFQVDMQQLAFLLEGFQLELNGEGKPVRVNGVAHLEMSALDARVAETGDKLLSLKRFDSGQFQLQKNEGVVEIQTAKLVLENILLSQVVSQKDLPPLFATEALSIENLLLSEKVIQLGKVDLAGGNAFIKLLHNGHFATLAEVGGEQDSIEEAKVNGNTIAVQEKTEAVDPLPAEAGAPVIRIGRIETSKPLKVNIEDHSNQRSFEKQFTIKEVTVSNVDSSLPEQKTEFTFAAKDEEYFTAVLSGWAQPFKAKLNLEASGELREFPLYQIAPYLQSTLGFEVKSGQLDTDISAHIADDVLDSEADVTLRKATFASSQKVNDESNLVGQAAIPLDVALGMLKDGNGDIKLKLPVKGDVNEPSFDVSHIIGLVIRKVAMSQAKSYLMTMLVPYKDVVTVAMAAGSYALKVRFEDLLFEPLQVEPLETQREFMQQLSALMKDKPELIVTVCPVAVAEDISLLPGAKLTAEQHNAVLNIANTRAKNIKASLVNEYSIESARLLLCSPKVDNKPEAKPRVEFKT